MYTGGKALLRGLKRNSRLKRLRFDTIAATRWEAEISGSTLVLLEEVASTSRIFQTAKEFLKGGSLKG